LGRARLEEALVPVSLPPIAGVTAWGNGDGSQLSSNGRALAGGWLRILTSGAPPPDPGELVGSRAIAEIISRLRESSDIVIVDTPPVLHVGDAMTLSPRVDALLLVVKLDSLRGPTLRELARVLSSCPTRQLGYILTGVEAMEDYYGYGYSGYYTQRPAQEQLERTTSA